MKKHFLLNTNQKERPHYPFWMPWGAGGCLWRSLLGLLLIALFLLLLLFLSSLFRGCDHSDPEPEREGEVINPPADIVRTDTIEDFKPVVIPDSVPDNDVPAPEPVRDAPKDFRPDSIVNDPNRPRQIDAEHLFVIIDQQRSQADPAIEAFVREFKALYPAPECEVEAVNDDTQMVLLRVPPHKRDQIKHDLPSQISDVTFYIDEVAIFGGNYRPDDPAMTVDDACWHYEKVLAPEAWDITKGNPKVKVAVIDSYFDLSHPDFRGMKIESPISVERGTTDVAPGPDCDPNSVAYFHGTHVLGLVGAQMNGIGAVGVAPECTFIPISLGQSMNSFTLIQAVLYAMHKGANVINVSVGLNLPDEIASQFSIDDQLAWWINEGKAIESSWDYVYDMLDRNYCTIVWSAGNNNLFELMDDSKRGTNTIKVDAVDRNLNKADFSNFGNIDYRNGNEVIKIRESVISAPGVPIFSTVPGREFAIGGGTSQAAPIVTGAVALMKSLDPTLSNAEIIEILQTTGKKLKNDSIGPLLQIRPALDAVKANNTKWNDFKKNPAGLWKKADQSTYVDTETREFRYYAHDYFIFDDRDGGIVEVHEVGRNNISNARFRTSWGQDECILQVVDAIRDVDGQQITTQQIRLFKDKDGDVGYEVINPRNDKVSTLKKLKTDDRINTRRRAL